MRQSGSASTSGHPLNSLHRRLQPACLIQRMLFNPFSSFTGKSCVMSECQTTSTDHPILNAIVAFIESPTGQSLIQTLVNTLIGSLTPKQAAALVALAAKHSG